MPAHTPTTGCGTFCKKLTGKLCEKCVDAEIIARMEKREAEERVARRARPFTEWSQNDLAAEVVDLTAERDALREAATKLLSHYTTKPHCGHPFTCVCKDNDIAALRALLEAK